MEALKDFLPQVWFVILALFLFLYVMLDGFDLGVGILSLTSSDEERRGILMTSLGNIWDANETWLVIMGGALFGAFPLAYGAGSFIAALGQGFALGSVIAGIKVDASGHFIGSTWDWLDWRSLLVALTLIQGYVLIGSTYLILKTEGELQKTHFRTAKIAAITTFIGAILITIATPIVYEAARTKLFSAPLVYIFAAIPVIGVWLIWNLLSSLNREEENTPFVWTILLFLLTFIGLGLIVFPYIIPNQITIYQAAAAPSALVFMLTFIGVLIPIMLFYNIYNYVVFRGKVVGSAYGD
jgi:cytochrome d ubiquinol oxidase subunit II